MRHFGPLHAAGLALVLTLAGAANTQAQQDICVDCLKVRVGPPQVVRGPFPDELDAAFSAIKLPDGRFRGFSANGATYAIDGDSLSDMGGKRIAVLEPGPEGSVSDCGRWLTSTVRAEDRLIGFVHQERSCDYNAGRTDKSMAIATSSDDGLTWTDLGTVITGTDSPLPDSITGEGDCSLVDGHDGFLYAYCLRNSDWQTIVARAAAADPIDWRKYHEGQWREPGLGGEATDIGFVGTGAGYLDDLGWVAAVATDPWFNGLRLSLSADKVSFVDLDEPLAPIDGSDWDRPASTDLSAYVTLLNPEAGGNSVGNPFTLAYIFVPAGKGFESRYLVQRSVSLTLEDTPQPIQVGLALTRWIDPATGAYISSTGPLTGTGAPFVEDATVSYMLTRAPNDLAAVKFAECKGDGTHVSLAEDGRCQAGYIQGRTAGWLLLTEQAGTAPVYQCRASATQQTFVSDQPDCEGLGSVDQLLGFGLTP